MGSKKLVWCCIAGIILGYLAPFALPVLRSTSLSIGMVVGLGLGYLLDILDEKKGKEADTAVISKKAQEANRLMEHARAELNGIKLPPADETADNDEYPEEKEFPKEDYTQEDYSGKMNQAEALLRKAREEVRR